MRNKLLALLDSYGPELHTLLVRLTLRVDVAEDLLQDLFVKLAESKALNGAVNPRAYMRRMAINLAFDWRRARDRNQRLMASCSVGEVPGYMPAWLKLSQREQVERILTLAAQLPELQRQAFALRFVRGESYEQIGHALDRTTHQARGLCHAAIHEIRKQFEDPEQLKGASLAASDAKR